MITPPKVEPLGAHHDRGGFSCGDDALDLYIRQQASQDVRRRIAHVFVAIGETPQEIAGYYSLSATAFRREDLPVERAKKLPRYPVPAAIIGRLAVATAFAGQKLGTYLLLDAVQRVLNASEVLATYAVIVDAKSDDVVGFYTRLGFTAFPATPRRLFLPLETFVNAGL